MIDERSQIACNITIIPQAEKLSDLGCEGETKTRNTFFCYSKTKVRKKTK